MENAVLVADAVSVRGHPQGRERIEEAGSESTEATIAKAGVPLGVAQILEGVAEIEEGVTARFEDAEVHRGVAERAAHEELE